MKGQVQALMDGLVSDDPNKAFSGKRPVSIVMLSFCSPHTLGQLIAFYENKTMYEGFIWDINSFDQEGVQLGKQMMTDILNASRNQ